MKMCSLRVIVGFLQRFLYAILCVPTSNQSKVEIDLKVEYNRDTSNPKIEELLEEKWKQKTAENSRLYSQSKFRLHSHRNGFHLTCGDLFQDMSGAPWIALEKRGRQEPRIVIL